MSFTSRVFYAFAIATTVVGILMVGDMLFRFGAGQFMFSPYFVIPLLAVGYVIAPYLARRLKVGP
jgi:hypothetical protein